MLPVWAIIAVVLGVVLFLGACVVLGVIGYRAFERRRVLALLVKLEATEAAEQALVDVLGRLADATDEELHLFAHEPGSSERRVLGEISRRAEILADESDRMPLPRALLDAAEANADAAFVIAREAGRVGEKDSAQEALGHVAMVQLDSVRGYTSQARRRTAELCASCGLEETNVYGGGLYL